ncbi:MAG: hypothetical protein DRN15_04615 [Thermoprotei archaeon]|nr:MAG: hypothetical protein DRN15_04615 [Thermoprotei archaeon]RLF25897.1 MAG: hypothetical protein DRM97_00215 [Thermoprotei archaeon]
MMTEEYLKKILNTLKECVHMLDFLGDIRSVVVFGSAVRPQDFVVGVSDVDVLVITKEEPRRRLYRTEIYDARVDITVMTIGEVYKVFEDGHPLAFMLYRSSQALVDDGAFAKLMRSVKPKVSEYTLKVLRRSAFVALELGLEDYFWELYREATSHACHAVRHIARYVASLRGANAESFPITDQEICHYLSKASQEAFLEIIMIRRQREVTRRECISALERAREVISREIGCKIPSFYEIDEAVRRRAAFIRYARIIERPSNEVMVRCEVLTDEGNKVEVLEFTSSTSPHDVLG